MSDILIKNMEMPKNCEECPFFDDIYTRVDDDDTYRCDLIGGLSYWQYAGETEKDCPLVHVPPHGRLIDADALLESIKEAKKKQPEISDVYDEDYFAVAEWVAYAPTIIPAEEGER